MTNNDNLPKADHDSPWKMALDAYFNEFLDLLFVLVKKSDRLLFVSFWFARQSVSGLFLLPASTVGASFG